MVELLAYIATFIICVFLSSPISWVKTSYRIPLIRRFPNLSATTAKIQSTQQKQYTFYPLVSLKKGKASALTIQDKPKKNNAIVSTIQTIL
jgi:hypothetical protein